MTDFDLRQDKAYRRGLVLGLTVAETMILLVFALLFTLSASLYSKDQEIAYLQSTGSEPGIKDRLMQIVHDEYPEAQNIDQIFKELKLSHEARRLIDKELSDGSDLSTLTEDAEVGRFVRELAKDNDIDKSEAIKSLEALLKNKNLITKETIEKIKSFATSNNLSTEDLSRIYRI